MKKNIVIAFTLLLSFGMLSFIPKNETVLNQVSVGIESSTFKVINDTGSKVKLKHKGGSVSLNNGGSTSLSCKRDGNVIYINGNAVHTVSASDCGNSYKLSKWM